MGSLPPLSALGAVARGAKEVVDRGALGIHCFLGLAAGPGDLSRPGRFEARPLLFKLFLNFLYALRAAIVEAGEDIGPVKGRVAALGIAHRVVDGRGDGAEELVFPSYFSLPALGVNLKLSRRKPPEALFGKPQLDMGER